MKKQEFLKMMVQDNETQPDKSKKIIYAEVIDCMELALSQTSDNVDIRPDINLKDAFKLIEDEAKRNGDRYCGSCGPFRAAELLAEYLGVKYIRATKKFASVVTVRLEDFLI